MKFRLKSSFCFIVFQKAAGFGFVVVFRKRHPKAFFLKEIKLQIKNLTTCHVLKWENYDTSDFELDFFPMGQDSALLQ